MAHHAAPELTDADTAVLGNRAGAALRLLLGVGGACVVLALFIAMLFPDGIQRFAFSYLVAYAFCFAVVLGCLFFVIITTLFRAGWCAMIRRVAETFAACVPTMAVLFLPLAVYVAAGSEMPYPWAYAGDAAHDTQAEDSDGGEDHGEKHDGDPHEAGDDHGDHAAASQDSPVGPVAMIDDDTPNDAKETGGAHHGPPTFPSQNAEDWAWHSGGAEYYTKIKYPWFEGWFWTLRWVLYFGVFGLIGVGYWRLSVRQDRTADPELTNTREKYAPAAVIAFALTTTFMALDLLMSIDPVFFSTMFGVIFFANAFTAGLATMILVLTVLQKRGYLARVSTDHYHDLGKLLFAFVFFWGYVSFSQFMLIWYASLPETTYWYELRGVTTSAGSLLDNQAPTFNSGWSWVALFLLFFHLFLPFAILLSKHVKRHPFWRVVMAVWMLVVVYVDLYWYVMPAYSAPDIGLGFVPIDLLVLVGLVCVLLAAALRRAAAHSLVAHNDPRMHESLGLDTNVWAPIHGSH